MAYFRELPNIKYASVFNERKGIDEYTLVKNIFKRPKLRDDFANVVTAFTYYQVSNNERPDQIAKKYYGNEDLDWVVLISNNITNLNEQWPLDNDSLYNYMIEKYGSEEGIQQIHHYETIEYTDEFGRVIIEGGLIVDTFRSEVIETNETDNSYIIESFPAAKANTVISVNLNQSLSVYTRDNVRNDFYITDIQTTTSNLKITTPNEVDSYNVVIINSLSQWPNSWGGILRLGLRNGNTTDIRVGDIILDNKVRLAERLYEISGTLINGEIRPTFNFTNEITQ
jgi:hypothetical protein